MGQLVVVVPGILGPREWDNLIARLKKEEFLAGAQWLIWDHKKRFYGLGQPERIARTLRARIDQEWAARGPFDNVILVGHSFGGLLVRRAYLLAEGVDYSTRQQ